MTNDERDAAVHCLRELSEVCAPIYEEALRLAIAALSAPTLTPAQAAADELLAALKLLSKDATTTRAVWVKVKAAIAKAEGCET